MKPKSPKRKKKEIKEDVTGFKLSGTVIDNGFRWPCGCSITTPHSHLIAGDHQCPCEKGLSHDTK